MLLRFIDSTLLREWTVQSLIVDQTHQVLVSGMLVLQKSQKYEKHSMMNYLVVLPIICFLFSFLGFPFLLINHFPNGGFFSLCCETGGIFCITQLLDFLCKQRHHKTTKIFKTLCLLSLSKKT